MTLEERHEEQDEATFCFEGMINACDYDDPKACSALAESVAEVATNLFFENRWGYFGGEYACIVYANMGSNNQSTRDQFRRTLAQAGVEELAVAVWPKGDAPEPHYNWAVFIHDGHAERWLAAAKDAWLKENLYA